MVQTGTGPPRFSCTCASASQSSPSKPFSSSGFTLIELLVVIVILSVVLAVVFPKISNLDESYLRTDAERMSGLIGYLSETSVSRKGWYRLTFDLEKDELTVERSEDGSEFRAETETRFRSLKLSSGVSIRDIVIPGLGKTETGSVIVVLGPNGAADPFTVHLGAGDLYMTISVNPYTGEVRTYDKYF